MITESLYLFWLTVSLVANSVYAVANKNDSEEFLVESEETPNLKDFSDKNRPEEKIYYQFLLTKGDYKQVAIDLNFLSAAHFCYKHFDNFKLAKLSADKYNRIARMYNSNIWSSAIRKVSEEPQIYSFLTESVSWDAGVEGFSKMKNEKCALDFGVYRQL